MTDRGGTGEPPGRAYPARSGPAAGPGGTGPFGLQQVRPWREAALGQLRPWGGISLAVLCAAGFAALSLLIASHWAPLVRLDTTVADRTHAAVVPHETWVQVLRVAGDVLQPISWVALAVFAGVLLAFTRRARLLAAWVVVTAAAGMLIESGLKVVIARPRPTFPNPIETLAGFSYPSGHATASALVCGALIVTVRHQRLAVRVASRTAAALVVLATGADRVLLGAHHLSDVAGSWLLAAVVLAATSLAFGLVARPERRPAPPPVGRRPRVALVLNPVKVENVAVFRRRVEALAVRYGFEEPAWYTTTPQEPGTAAARDAVRAGADVVVAVGGDGTVRAVAMALAGTDVALGIVPAGTGNLLARHLGLPLDHEEAVTVALRGGERRIDLVRLEGDGLPSGRFLVMAGIGLDAAIVRGAPEALKAHVGWPAYVIAGVRNLSFPGVRVEIAVDGAPPERRWARTVVVGNIGTLTAGVPLIPDAEPDDGRLDVLALAPLRAGDWWRVGWRILRSAPQRDSRLTVWHGRSVVVRAFDDCPRQVDGDVVPPGRELRCAVEPAALIVRVGRPGGPARSRALAGPADATADATAEARQA